MAAVIRLRAAGVVADVASTGDDAQGMAATIPYDVIADQAARLANLVRTLSVP